MSKGHVSPIPSGHSCQDSVSPRPCLCVPDWSSSSALCLRYASSILPMAVVRSGRDGQRSTSADETQPLCTSFIHYTFHAPLTYSLSVSLVIVPGNLIASAASGCSALSDSASCLHWDDLPLRSRPSSRMNTPRREGGGEGEEDMAPAEDDEDRERCDAVSSRADGRGRVAAAGRFRQWRSGTAGRVSGARINLVNALCMQHPSVAAMVRCGVESGALCASSASTTDPGWPVRARCLPTNRKWTNQPGKGRKERIGIE